MTHTTTYSCPLKDTSNKETNTDIDNINNNTFLFRVKNKKAHLTLENTEVFMRVISVEGNLTEPEIIEDIELVFENTFPLKLNDCVYDFVVLGPNTVQPNLIDIVLMAAPIQKVKATQDLLNHLTLTPAVLETQALSLERLFNFIIESNPKEIHFLVLLEEDQSFIYAFQDKILPYEKKLNINRLNSFVEIAEEVHRGLNLFFDCHPNAHGFLPHVFLAGAGSYEEEILPFLEQRLNKNIVIFDPCSKIKDFSSCPLYSRSTLISLGAALRGFNLQGEKTNRTLNLYPWREERRRQLNKRFLNYSLVVFAISLLLLGLMHGFFSFLLHQETAKFNDLNLKLSPLKEKIQILLDLEKNKEALRSRLSVIQELNNERSRMVRLLDRIPHLIPEGVYLNELNHKNSSLTLIGFAKTNAAISILLKNLEHPSSLICFNAVKLSEVFSDKKTNALKFKIEFQLEKENNDNE